MLHSLPCMQIEVFYELHSSEIAAANHAARRGGGARRRGDSVAGAGARIFATPEDRQGLLSLLLHCADISNPVKPAAIAEK